MNVHSAAVFMKFFHAWMNFFQRRQRIKVNKRSLLRNSALWRKCHTAWKAHTPVVKSKSLPLHSKTFTNISVKEKLKIQLLRKLKIFQLMEFGFGFVVGFCLLFFVFFPQEGRPSLSSNCFLFLFLAAWLRYLPYLFSPCGLLSYWGFILLT